MYQTGDILSLINFINSLRNPQGPGLHIMWLQTYNFVNLTVRNWK